jgi:HEAT repeat protein
MLLDREPGLNGDLPGFLPRESHEAVDTGRFDKLPALLEQTVEVADQNHQSTIRDLGLVDADPALRISIAGGAVGALAADQFAIAMLDAHATVRRAAVEGLIRVEPGKLLFAQLRLAIQDPDPVVREEAVEVLSEVNDPRSVTILHEILEAAGLDTDAIAREEAAEALYRLNSAG